MSEFWGYFYDEEFFDLEAESEQVAIDHATTKFIEELDAEGGLRNAVIYSRAIELIKYDGFDDDGHINIRGRKDHEIEYEHYHGDKAEHGYP
jgi:hypothetical protein